MANQYVNKVIIGKEVKLDLTADSVTPDKLAKGITAHDKTGAPITGTSTKDVDSTDATVAVAEMLDGKTAYARGAKLTGTMPNNGAVAGKITQKDGKYTIPMGFHDGSGSACTLSDAVCHGLGVAGCAPEYDCYFAHNVQPHFCFIRLAISNFLSCKNASDTGSDAFRRLGLSNHP